MTIHIARQASATASPELASGEWSAFVGALRNDVATEHACDVTNQAAIDAAKVGMPAWIPARLSLDKMVARLDRGEKSARGSEVVDGSSVIALDVDGCPSDRWQHALTLLPTLAAVAHTSPTDGLTPGVRKGRVFVQLATEVPPGQVWPLRCALAEALGVREWLDNKTKDPSRIFFAGRLQGTPEREFHAFDGAPLEPAALLSAFPQAVAEQQAAATATVRPDAAPLDVAREAAIAALLEPYFVKGERHAITRALGGALAKSGFGWSADEIKRVVLALPCDDPDHHITNVVDAFERVRRDEPTGNWSSLVELGVPSHIAVAAEALANRDADRLVARQLAASSAQAPVTGPTATPDGLGRAATEDALEDELERPVRAYGYRLGFSGLDQYIDDGVAPGDTIILGGEGDAGKTQFLLQSCNSLRSQGVAVVWVAADEERERIALRQAQTLLGLKRGELSEAATFTDACSTKIRLRKDIREKLKEIRKNWGPIAYVDDPMLDRTAEQCIREFKAKGLEVALAVDSTQTVSVTNAPADRRQQVDAVVARWRVLCRSTETLCIGLASSETGREFYKGAKQRPTNLMAAFKESGSIEYAARFAVVLEPGDDETCVTAHIVKNKLGGRKGIVEFNRTPGLLAITDSNKPVKTKAETAAERVVATRAAILALLERGFSTSSRQAAAAVERSLPELSRDDVRNVWQQLLNERAIDRDSVGRWFANHPGTP